MKLMEMRRLKVLAGTLNEGMDDGLQGDLIFVFKEILKYAQSGRNPTDVIVDELGDYFDAVDATGDQDIKWAFETVRSLADEDDLGKIVNGVEQALKALGEPTSLTQEDSSLGDEGGFYVTHGAYEMHVTFQSGPAGWTVSSVRPENPEEQQQLESLYTKFKAPSKYSLEQVEDYFIKWSNRSPDGPVAAGVFRSPAQPM